MLTKMELGSHRIWLVNQYVLVVVWAVFRMGTDLVIWYYVLSNFWEYVHLFQERTGGSFVLSCRCVSTVCVATIFKHEPYPCETPTV